MHRGFNIHGESAAAFYEIHRSTFSRRQEPCPTSATLCQLPLPPLLCSGKAHPSTSPSKPVGGRARAFCQLGSSSSAMRTNALKTSGCDPHISGTVLEIHYPPSKSKSACGCAAQLVLARVFQKGENILQVLTIRKKI